MRDIEKDGLVDEREIENRLTRLEGWREGLERRMTSGERTVSTQISELGLSLSNQIDGVNAGVKDTRRILDLHLTKDEEWMDKHSIVHAREDGAREAQRELRKGDMAVIVLAVGITGAVIQVALKFL